MSDFAFLKRLFKAYYKEHHEDLPIINLFTQREIGLIPWDKQIMIRHLGFENTDYFKSFIIETVPRHLYASGSLYEQPNAPRMDEKAYIGCDLIIDIDVDHFYTPCKEQHDIWYCKECNNNGKGMCKKCSRCGSLKIRTLAWICDECLEVAKKEIIKLVDDFLIPDFGISEDEMKLAFSGHRGYHLKVENERIRTLSSEARRELVDYVSGDNLSFELLGLRERSGTIYGLSKWNVGWSSKIVNKMEEKFRDSDENIKEFLENNVGFPQTVIDHFLSYKTDFLDVLNDPNHNIWAMEGFQLVRWKKLLSAIVKEIGAEIDEPVTIDTHRLIRYPGSLHGKTGFKVQELNFDQLKAYVPLDESDPALDPVVFKSNITHKLEVTEPILPVSTIKGESFGPYSQGELIEVPHHIAVYLLSKEVARAI